LVVQRFGFGNHGDDDARSCAGLPRRKALVELIIFLFGAVFGAAFFLLGRYSCRQREVALEKYIHELEAVVEDVLDDLDDCERDDHEEQEPRAIH